MRSGATINKKEAAVMKLNIYSIFDTASRLYSRPFYSQADAEAVRSFQDIGMDATHPVGQHPEDYSLFRIGLFDDSTGSITNEANECLVTGLETVARARNMSVEGQNEISASIQ